MSLQSESSNTRSGVLKEMKEVESEVDRLIAKAQQGCVDRGVDPISGKRGVCHSFKSNSDVCLCGAIDLKRERMS